MSRPLKFRVWDIRQGRYLLPDDKTRAYYYLYPPREESIAREQGRGVGIVHLGHAINQTDKYVVEQFTGWIDAGGKDVYEGDIVQITDLEPKPDASYSLGQTWMKDGSDPFQPVTRKFKVYWSEKDAMFQSEYIGWLRENAGTETGKPVRGILSSSLVGAYFFDVIGNIHENPELVAP